MITSLIRELRSRGVRVGTQEAVALAGALAHGLHDNSLEQFYHVARALLIHDESQIDDFDQVFSHVFQNIPYRTTKLAEDLRDWLSDPVAYPELSEEERQAIRELPIEDLLKMFEERLKEQKERHDGGSHWIGTGGTSPFGTGGYHPSGISLRSGPRGGPPGGRSMIRSADARRYRAYRHDLILDVRQVEVALRKLRTFDRDDHRRELDVPASVDATAKNFGELELVFSKPRRPNTRVILMMDVGGSMDPYAALISQLFSAAKRATHWKELRTYYFHNCVYDRVYKTDGMREPVLLKELLRECDSRYKLILVGDASMAPYELSIDYSSFYGGEALTGLTALTKLRAQFPKSVWLNPEPARFWPGSTVETIANIFPMYPLTIAGMEEGLHSLTSGKSHFKSSNSV